MRVLGGHRNEHINMDVAAKGVQLRFEVKDRRDDVGNSFPNGIH